MIVVIRIRASVFGILNARQLFCLLHRSYPFVCADKTFQKGNFYWRMFNDMFYCDEVSYCFFFVTAIINPFHWICLPSQFRKCISKFKQLNTKREFVLSTARMQKVNNKLHWHSQHFCKEKVTLQEGWILLWGTIQQYLTTSMLGAAMVVYSGWIYIYIQSVPKATC